MPTTFALDTLADLLQKAAKSINDGIHANFERLSILQIQQLSGTAQDLAVKSKMLLELSTIQLAQEAADDLEKLDEATNEINNFIKKLDKIQEVIDIAAQLVGIAGNIVGGDFSAIIAEVPKVLEAVSGAA